jgi:adenine deaminase
MNGFGPLAAVKKRNPELLMNVALGKAAADLVIINARLVNVYTAEILENYAVGVKGEWIAYVGETPEPLIGPATEIIDASGQYLIPGLIEGHTHLAWLFGIDEFLIHAIPGGTTTIITESLEPYPVCGIGGVLDFLSSLQDQPIKIFATAPAMVSISQKSLGISPEDLKTLLDRDDILGIGESYWQGVLQTPEVFLPKFDLTLQKSKVLEGHSAGTRQNKLIAYAACGISSCHEPITAEETLERLRLGIYVMAREGSIRRDLKTISKIKEKKVDLRRLILSTDGVTPAELLENGFLEHAVKRAIGYGFDAVSAIQMATLNVAEHFKIDHLVGGIAPGKYADMLILPDFPTFSPDAVISCGKVVAQNGTMKVAPRKHLFSTESTHSIRLAKAVAPSDFILRAPSRQPSVNIRVIEMVTDLVTAEKILPVPVQQEKVSPLVDQKLLKVTALDRTHGSGHLFTGLIQGFGLKSGALASSAAWDTSDIIVVGTNDADMALAVNRIIALQGAAVLCDRGEIIAELALPVFGLMSNAPMEEIAARVKDINEKANELGVPFPDPLLTLITLTGAAIPYFRICDEGLVNLKDGKRRNLFPDEV